MSVSSRSPTTSGRRAPVRRTASRWIGGSGLPATTGRRPVADRIASTRRPVARARCPVASGWWDRCWTPPRGCPVATAYAPSASSRHPTSGWKPDTTAAGSSSALATGVRPRSVERSHEPFATDNEHPGAGRQTSPPAPGRPPGRRSPPRPRRRRYPSSGAARPPPRAASRVVGDEGQAHAGRSTRLGQCRGGVIDGVRPDVDDTVEVDQGDIVGLGERSACGDLPAGWPRARPVHAAVAFADDRTRAPQTSAHGHCGWRRSGRCDMRLTRSQTSPR